MSVISPTFAHHCDLDMIQGYQDISQDGMRILVPRGLLASDKRTTWDNPSFPEEANVTQQYDLMTGKPVHEPLPDKQDFYDFPVYDQSSSKIATQVDGQIHVWNAMDGSLLHTLVVPPPIAHMSLRFDPHGKQLLATDRSRAILWELGNETPIENWNHDGKFTTNKDFTQVIYKATHGNFYHSFITCDKESTDRTRNLNSYGQAWFSEDGSKYMLEAESLGEKVDNEPRASQVFDSLTGMPLSPPWHMTSTVFHDTLLSNDGRYVVSLNNGLLVWDLNDRQSCLSNYPNDPSITVMASDYNESRTALAILDSQQQVTVLDTNTQHLLYPPLTLDNDWNRDEITLSSDASFLLQVQESKLLTLWDLKQNKAIWKNKNYATPITGISEVQFVEGDKGFCLIETEVYSVGNSNSDIKTAYRGNVFAEPLMSPAFEKPKRTYLDTKAVSLGNYKGQAVLVEITGPSSSSELDSPPEPSVSTESPKSNQVEIHLYDPVTLSELIAPIKGPRMSPKDMEFTRDGGKLVLSHGEVWDTKSSRLEASVADRQTDQVVIGDDGREFLLVSEGGGTLWSPPGRIARFSIQGIALGSQMISPSNGELKVCYHPQDQVLGSSANGLRLWDLHTSAPITRNFEVQGHRRGKLPIFFSPMEADSTRLVISWLYSTTSSSQRMSSPIRFWKLGRRYSLENALIH